VEQSALLSRLTPLLEPSEVQRMGLAHPPLQLRGATASLERQRVLRRCRHLLDAWSSQRLQTLEHCIARLLEEERHPPPAGSAPPPPGAGLDMETRIHALFDALNGDALRFQEAYYAERRYLLQLDDGRRAGYEETLSVPAA
jgi:DNA primase